MLQRHPRPHQRSTQKPNISSTAHHRLRGSATPPSCPGTGHPLGLVQLNRRVTGTSLLAGVFLAGPSAASAGACRDNPEGETRPPPTAGCCPGGETNVRVTSTHVSLGFAALRADEPGFPDFEIRPFLLSMENKGQKEPLLFSLRHT